MKELVGKLEDNLNIVERLYMRINKRQQDLQNDYANFATSIQGLSSLESNITHSLHQFAETSKAYSKAMQEMTEKEEMQFLNEIHALLAYCSAAKVKDCLCVTQITGIKRIIIPPKKIGGTESQGSETT